MSLLLAEEDLIVPSISTLFLGGVSSSDDIEELASHAHDPNQERTIQAIELGLSIHPLESLSGFFNINTFLTTEDELDTEWEEGFLKLHSLPAGFEVRGGRYLNRIGRLNNIHLHAWDYVDSNLSTAYFFGEEGLVTEGGELTWAMEYDQFNVLLSASYGAVVTHDHHGHGEEEHDEEEGEEEHDEHGMEGALFNEDAFTLRALTNYNYNDFQQHSLGLSYAFGGNDLGEDTRLFGIDYYYTWRENGLETGGRAFSVGAEYYQRGVDWSEEDEGGNFDQSSFLVQARYEFNEYWSLGCRYDWVEGVQEGLEIDEDTLEEEYHLDSEERERLSLALTFTRPITEQWTGTARLQYNHHRSPEFGGEDSLWLQLGFKYGGPEVR